MGRWGVFDLDKGRCGNFEHLTESWLVLYIFSMLEIEQVFKLRAVCKSWYDAILSPHFTQLYKPRLDPWAVLRVRTGQPRPRDGDEEYDYGYFDYNMELENHVELWRPSSGLSRKRCPFPLGPTGSNFVGLCSSNGLTCGMLMEEQGTLTLAVGNPLLNKWRTLPAAPIDSKHLLRPAYLSIYMEANPVTSSYQIVVLYEKMDEDEDQVYPVQYESDSGSWQHGPFFTAQSSSRLPLRGYAFYNRLDEVFMAYDPHQRAWSHIFIGRPVCDDPDDSQWADWTLAYIGAFRYKGKCYWASLLFHSESFEEIGPAIWELDETNSRWVLVSRVLSRDLFGSNWCLNEDNKDMKLMLVCDTLFISAFYRQETYGAWPPVAYDFVLSKWYSCATSSSLSRLDHDIECSYVVLPSLTAES